MDTNKLMELKKFALEIRIGAIEQFEARGFGHVGGSLSIADILAVLYGKEMKYNSKIPDWPERDKLVCSKGHAGPALYSALALKGFFPYAWLVTLNQPGTMLPSHCDHNKTPGIDMTTGSLGQGTSLAVGAALAGKLSGLNNRVFLIVGDGEMNEGQVWEAMMFAAAHKLDNLIFLVDNNGKQLDGTTKDVLDIGSIKAKFEAFDFHTMEIDGNDINAIDQALEQTKNTLGRPHAIVCKTIKGAGVAEVENMASNHSINPTKEQCEKWKKDLREEIAAISGGSK